MKKELLEYLVRETVKQLLEAAAVEEPTVGAPAPPEAGQGTADQPAIPQASPDTKPFATIPQKGVWFVSQKQTKPIQIQFGGTDPRSLETAVYQAAAKSGGPNIRASLETMRNVTNAVKNPSSALFLFVGQDDPADPESGVAIKSAPSYEQALELSKQASGQSAERSGTSISSDPTDLQGMAKNWQSKQAGGKTLAPDIDEGSKFRNMLSSMIREALKNTKR